MAYVGDELPKPFSNLTEKSYVPLAIGFWDSSFLDSLYRKKYQSLDSLLIK